MTTVKYDPAGVGQWVANYDGPSHSEFCAAIAVDSLANVYVTGSSHNPSGYFDYATIKYDAAGVEQWVQRYDGGGSGTDTDYPNAIVVDREGNVYVTGESDATSPFISDYATIKYDATGNEEWVARYDGPSQGDDAATDIALDNSGNIYVTGSSESNYATIKYDPNGALQWVEQSQNDAGDVPQPWHR
jgi:hypothetical protein